MDSINMDVVLFIRCLEVAREQLKTDEQLHKFAESIMSAAEPGKTLTMDDYDAIIGDDPVYQEQEEESVVASIDRRLVMSDLDPMDALNRSFRLVEEETVTKYANYMTTYLANNWGAGWTLDKISDYMTAFGMPSQYHDKVRKRVTALLRSKYNIR